MSEHIIKSEDSQSIAVPFAIWSSAKSTEGVVHEVDWSAFASAEPHITPEKDGRCVVFARMRPDESGKIRHARECVIANRHLVADLDDVDRRVFEALIELWRAQGRRFIAWPTFSELTSPKQETVRARVLFATDAEVAPSAWKHFVRSAYASLDLDDPGVDGHAANPAQLWYLTCPADRRVAFEEFRARYSNPNGSELIRVLEILEPVSGPAQATRAEPTSGGEGKYAPIIDARIRAIVELLTPYYVRGRRYDMAFAIGGTLRSWHWSDASIRRVVEALPSENPTDRVRCALKAEHTGQGRLRDYLPAEVHEELMRLCEHPMFAELAPTRSANDAALMPWKRQIDASQDLAVIIDDAIEALAACEIYQRSGVLVHVTREAIYQDGIVRPAGTPTIRTLGNPRLLECLDSVAEFTKIGKDGKEYRVQVPAHLPGHIIARGEWAHIRPLVAIVDYPCLRPDGTILSSQGYDAATATILTETYELRLPECPNQEDAQKALETLLTVVQDFPFSDDMARAAWVSAVLTAIARPAISGPVPGHMFEANTRACGKTLLAECVNLIVRGRAVARRTAPSNEEEWSKVVFAFLRAGDPITLVDNITSKLKSAALDAVLTSTEFEGRVLGESRQERVPNRALWMFTSNNATVSPDLVRRLVWCRLSSLTLSDPKEQELPEQRAGFKIPNLEEYILEHRQDLLAAALTILRAYAINGRPKVRTRHVGSFESWARVVRDALVWAGAPDYIVTQDALRDDADDERDMLREVLNAWRPAFGDAKLTVPAIVDALCNATSAEISALRRAVEAWCECKVTDGDAVRKVGYALRNARDQVVGGLAVRAGKRTNQGRQYRVA